MRHLLRILAVLLPSCGCLDTPVDAIPVLDITARMQAECDEHGLTSMALVIRGEDGELVELAVGEMHGSGGGRVDPFEVGWALAPTSVSFGRPTDREWCVSGRFWSYEGRTVPARDVPGLPLHRLGDLARLDESGLYRSEAGVTWLRRTSSDGRWSVVVATDTVPAPGPLRRVADAAMQFVCEGALPPDPEPLHAIDRVRTRAILGRYTGHGGRIEILEIDGEPWLVPETGAWMHLRAGGDPDVLVVRDRLNEECRVRVADGAVVLDGARYAKIDVPAPACPPDVLPLLGSYSYPDHDLPRYIVLERHGELRLLSGGTLVERTLTPTTSDSRTFATGDPEWPVVMFRTDSSGLASMVFPYEVRNEDVYRKFETATGTFQITPVHPEAELRRLADAASPPPPPPEALPFDLVELRDLDPTIRYDIRYATDDNFLGFPVYERAFAQMQRPAAEALVRAHHRLMELGYGIMVHDAWRPWRVTKMFYDATPEDMKVFVADPTKGSRHNRGCAVDITLYEADTGAVVEMPSLYDEFTPRAYPAWPGGTGRSRAMRDLLRHTMEDEGFTVYEAEWWHFDYRDWRRYAVR